MIHAPTHPQSALSAVLFAALAPTYERRAVLALLGLLGAAFGAAASLSWTEVAGWVWCANDEVDHKGRPVATEAEALIAALEAAKDGA